MFAQGFIDEVADLVANRGLIADSTAGRAIGYAQILAARAGQLAWDDVLERTILVPDDTSAGNAAGSTGTLASTGLTPLTPKTHHTNKCATFL